MGQGCGKNFHASGGKQSAHLLNAGGVGAVAVADQQSLWVEPEEVSGFGGTGRCDFAEGWDVEALAE